MTNNQTKPILTLLPGVEKIMSIANRCYNIAEYLSNPKNKEEEEAINRHKFLSFTRDAYLRLLVIELNKFTSKDQEEKHSINNLLKSVKENLVENKEEYLKNNLEDEFKVKIELWETWRDKNNAIEKTIKIKFKNLKNKSYTHLDINEKNFYTINKLTWPEINEVFFKIKELVEYIFTSVTGYISRLDDLAEINFAKDFVKRLVQLEEIEALYLSTCTD